jgi:hypothetical protein
MFSSFVDSSNMMQVLSAIGAQIKVEKIIGGVTIAAAVSYAHQKGVPFQWQAYYSSSYGMGIRVRYWLGLAWSAWTEWATNADTQDVPIASTFEIGSRNDALHFDGNYQMFRTYWSADPKAWLESQG